MSLPKSRLKKPRRIIPLEELIVPFYNTAIRKKMKKVLPQRLKAYRKNQARAAVLLKRHNKRLTKKLKGVL